MATKYVFHSWQSDLPNPTNRGSLRESLDKATLETPDDDELEEPQREDAAKIDPDTAGVPGSPDIVATIV